MLRQPAIVKRTGVRQITESLTDEDAMAIEVLREQTSARSWGEVVRRLIQRAYALRRAAKGTR